jgi:hypothetical protein
MPIAYLLTLFLALASGPAHADIHKCLEGDRVIYQSQPCPANSAKLPMREMAPVPSAYEVEEARLRAKGDIAAADSLRKQEEKRTLAREKTRATARKMDTDCTRLLDKIQKAEAGKGKKKALKDEIRKYRKDCGEL